MLENKNEQLINKPEHSGLSGSAHKKILNEAFGQTPKHPFTPADIASSGVIANEVIKEEQMFVKANAEIESNPNLSKIEKATAINKEMGYVEKYFNSTNLPNVNKNAGDLSFLNLGVNQVNRQEIQQTMEVNKELGGVSGVDQGAYGDCWFESSLASLARTTQGQSAIAKMITQNKDGTYTVNFPGDKNDPITVSDADIKNDNLSNNTKWANIMEAAVIKRFPKQAHDGASAAGAMLLLTGEIGKTQYIDAKSKNEQIANILENGLNRNEILTAGTKRTMHNKSIIGNHDYTVIGYDPTTKYVTLRNPFGDNANSGNLPKDTAKVGGEPVDGVLNLGDGLIAMPIDTFKRNFDFIQHTVNNEK